MSLRLSTTASIERGRSKGRLPSGSNLSEEHLEERTFVDAVVGHDGRGRVDEGLDDRRPFEVEVDHGGDRCADGAQPFHILGRERQRPTVEHVGDAAITAGHPGCPESDEGDVGLGGFVDHGGVPVERAVAEALGVDRDARRQAAGWTSRWPEG